MYKVETWRGMQINSIKQPTAQLIEPIFLYRKTFVHALMVCNQRTVSMTQQKLNQLDMLTFDWFAFAFRFISVGKCSKAHSCWYGLHICICFLCRYSSCRKMFRCTYIHVVWPPHMYLGTCILGILSVGKCSNVHSCMASIYVFAF
jgi:hypothetical protein